MKKTKLCCGNCGTNEVFYHSNMCPTCGYIGKKVSTSSYRYESLKDMVLPVLESFYDDLLVHDKALLENYDGRFIYGVRRTGTDLFKLDVKDYKISEKADFQTTHKNSQAFVMRKENFMFLYGNEDGIKLISREEAQAILDAFALNELTAYQENIESLKIPILSFELEFFIRNNGRRWKSKLIEAFERDSEWWIRKIRNYFGFDFLKTIKSNMKEPQIKEAFYQFLNQRSMA
jgi:ribosomal protein L37E